jgi:hypothetical protein
MPRLVRLVHPLSSLGDSGDGCSTLVLQQPPHCTSIATPVRSILHQLHVHVACLLETGALGGGEGRRSVSLCPITTFALLSGAQILLPIPPVQPHTNTGAKERARRWRWSWGSCKFTTNKNMASNIRPHQFKATHKLHVQKCTIRGCLHHQDAHELPRGNQPRGPAAIVKLTHASRCTTTRGTTNQKSRAKLLQMLRKCM